jgi:hypothetical protein
MSTPTPNFSAKNPAEKSGRRKTPDQIYDEFEARQADKKRRELRAMWADLWPGAAAVLMIGAIHLIDTLTTIDTFWSRQAARFLPMIPIIFLVWEMDKRRKLEKRVEFLEQRLPNTDSNLD